MFGLAENAYTSPDLAGLGREERTKVGERSETGEGLAARTTLTRVAMTPRPLRRKSGRGICSPAGAGML